MSEDEVSEVNLDSDDDSDRELQVAFETGILKPGLNILTEIEEKKEAKNDVIGLKAKLESFSQTWPWIERLDLVSGEAPLAPELATKYEEEKQRREAALRNQRKGKKVLDLSNDPVLNEFNRELKFHRQAQAAVLEGIPRLKALGIATKRPEDYFAQMAKTDEHMQKVRELLMKKQHVAERIERVKQIRQQRKLKKQIQIEGKLKRAQEKKELLDEVKKFRKKIRPDLDFLDDKKSKSNKQSNNKGGIGNRKGVIRRKFKDQKFGFGGKKRGTKANTKESTSDVSEFRRPKKAKKQGGNKQRPGKSKRMKSKNRKKR